MEITKPYVVLHMFGVQMKSSDQQRMNIFTKPFFKNDV